MTPQITNYIRFAFALKVKDLGKFNVLKERKLMTVETN